MNNIEPKGIPVKLLDGVERHILFTLRAVSEIQSERDEPVSEVVALLADEKEVFGTIAYLATVLINDEARRTGQGEELTQEEVEWMIDVPLARQLEQAILRAYGYSLPEDEDDEDPNRHRSRSS